MGEDHHAPTGEMLVAANVVLVHMGQNRAAWPCCPAASATRHPATSAPASTACSLVDGRPIKAVAIVSEQAFTYVFDRATGEPVWPIEERAVPASTVPGEQLAPTQPFPTKPPPFDMQGVTLDDLIDFTPELRTKAEEILKRDYEWGPMFTAPILVDPANPGKKRAPFSAPALPAAPTGRAQVSIRHEAFLRSLPPEAQEFWRNIPDGAEMAERAGRSIEKGITWKTNHSLAGVNGLLQDSRLGLGATLGRGFSCVGGVVAQEAESSVPRIPPLESADGINITRTMAHHPVLAESWLPYARHVARESTLPPRERELLIQRIGYLCGSEYEWGHHTRIARGVGLSDEEIGRVTGGPDAAGWSNFDQVLLRAADELHRDGYISDRTWAELDTRYDTQQLMDVVFTVGYHNLMAMALKSFRVPLDEGVEGFPQ